jgi:hypothetical protein
VHMPINKKPVMILGQDKCIFKQYNLTKKSRVVPDRTRALLPKDDGQGIMVSAFVARELGYGMDLTPQQLDLINAERKNWIRHIIRIKRLLQK